MSRKVQAEFSDLTYGKIDHLSKLLNMSRTDAVSRAVALLYGVETERINNNAECILQFPNGRRVALSFK